MGHDCRDFVGAADGAAITASEQRENRIGRASALCARATRRTDAAFKAARFTALYSTAAYFDAICAHFASVLRNGYEAFGASTSPLSEVLKGTMWP